MTRCHACRQLIDRNHTWHRIDNGVTWHGTTITAQQDFCSLACLAATYPEPDQP